MKSYFEYVGPSSENQAGTASKFWEITVTGTKVIVRFGKIGVNGQVIEKEFTSAAEATEHATKLIAEKTKKGYSANNLMQ